MGAVFFGLNGFFGDFLFSHSCSLFFIFHIILHGGRPLTVRSGANAVRPYDLFIRNVVARSVLCDDLHLRCRQVSNLIHGQFRDCFAIFQMTHNPGTARQGSGDIIVSFA